MDDKICHAIAAVMAGLPKLDKAARNQHGGYNFASVDDFFEAVQPQMAKAGLVVTSDEQDFEVIGEGKDAWLKMRFAFVAHAGGAEYGPLMRTAMVRASMGSQALGAAQSYAEKQFLRSLFKMATGEGAGIDADSHPAADLPQQRQTRQHVQLRGIIKTKTALANAAKQFMAEVNNAADTDALDAWMDVNKPLIDQIKDEFPGWWDGSETKEAGMDEQIANAYRRIENNPIPEPFEDAAE